MTKSKCKPGRDLGFQLWAQNGVWKVIRINTKMAI